ncbi:MAG: IS256 family transposase [Candidatus Marinimicrobia bacterium]|jgi:putative transposase|nr:IS256 family transposase [Candidatus Neomarinimicrobiota bacterium]
MPKRTKQEMLIDELLKNNKNPEDILGHDGLLKQLTKSILERALEGEITDHLGHKKYSTHGKIGANSRNGTSPKVIKGDHGEIPIDVPRDREGTFEPQIVKKHQTRFDGFDDKIVALYARGMTTRDIKANLEEIYGVEVSPTLISNVTNEIMQEVKAWRSRPLEPFYPVVFLDAIRIKARTDGHIRNVAVYLAIGINADGLKEVLGMWIAQNEGAKFWLQVLTELKNRGLQDILIASVDGLKGFPEAIESVYPETQVQICLVHMVRYSLRYVSWKQRKEMAEDLKRIYSSSTEEEGRRNLDAFAAKWDSTHPMVSKSWYSNWERLSTFFEYPPEIRRVIYTTNAIESLNYSIRKVVRNRGSFPNEESVFKILYLALRNVSKKWTMAIRGWKAAMNHFSIIFEERVNQYL